MFEADCRKVSTGGESFDIGANPSAEEQEEGADDQKQTVIDIVHAFQLQETQFDKKSYLSYLKGYMKAVKAKLAENGASEEEVKDFETKAQGFAKKLIGNFGDYEFFIGSSMDADGM